MRGVRAVTIKDLKTDEVRKSFHAKRYSRERLSVDIKDGAVIVNERVGHRRRGQTQHIYPLDAVSVEVKH